MNLTSNRAIKRSPLALALLSGLLLPAFAFAQDANSAAPAKDLDKIVVTGSLIPQSQIETVVPVTVISAKDIQARGFSSLAEVLQKSSFATGGVQNNQTSGAFTQGAETLSLFGLSASYVKYLVDGRPMANYPGLYNGTDVFNNLSNIPVALVDRIEILPGGQSSLYGSDAIAGVVNIILKKGVDGSVLGGRFGGYDQGGGQSARLSFATSMESADKRWNTLLGVQLEKSRPVWAAQRDLTKRYNATGYSGEQALASRNWLVYSPTSSYKFLDPANCANVSAGEGGTVTKQARPGFGDGYFCGSMFTPGDATLKNRKESAQVYVHSAFDINDRVQAYADVLVAREKVGYNVSPESQYWSTQPTFGYYYDPRINDGELLNLQRIFTQEETGGRSRLMNQDQGTSYAVTVGINGTLSDASSWDYDASLSRTQYRLTQTAMSRLKDPINAYFQQHILGAQLGLDPTYNAYPVFKPDYAAFYTLLSPADVAGFMGRTVSHSETYDNLLRVQFTNGALFSLPGGDAGIALAAEAGKQGWNYTPDLLLTSGKIWGTTAFNGNGDRTRYAVTGELRLPLWSQLTASASARYDAYHMGGQTISKPTYNLGLEYRPFETLLVRGKYGTAFKAPTLADQFQGVSGFYSRAVDYYSCAKHGFDAGNVSGCPSQYADIEYFGQTSGNTALKPINAKVWSYGVVWAPLAKLSVSADYYHWNIRDEVSSQDVDQLLRDESNCRMGKLPASSGTCLAALSQITRGAGGEVQKIFLNKINIANETLNALALGVNYQHDFGTFGLVSMGGTWTRNFTHDFQPYPTDAVRDLLSNPYYSTDPKVKAEASLGWSRGRWASTVYANYIGKTPNYRATLDPSGYAFAGAGKLGAYTTFNGSVSYDVTEDLKVSLQVNNIGNRSPNMDVRSYPGNTGSPYNSYNYDVLGRAYFLDITWNFGKGK